MPEVTTIQLVHHSHTDIGHTHDQPVVWDLQRRFIDAAIDLAYRDVDKDSPDAFRWTMETTGPLLKWLETAPEERLERLKTVEAAGRIEVAGMLTNITPLYDNVELVESLRPVEYLRTEFGFDIAHAMNGDVTGQAWPLADVLLDAGIEGFSMAINETFGGAPLERPAVFRWEAPTGRELFALNGYHYSTGLGVGIGRSHEELRERWWPRLSDRLAAVEYPLPVVMIQTIHPPGDNGAPYDGYTSFIREWNDSSAVIDGDLPKIEMATPSAFWEIAKENADALPVHAGDWTDFWNFGSISSARETAINRDNRRRLFAADAMEAGLAALGEGLADRDPTRRSEPGHRDRAWWDVLLFDEHTWGPDTAGTVPAGEDTASQWNHKANYAYDGRSLSQMLRRDAIAELARRPTPEDAER